MQSVIAAIVTLVIVAPLTWVFATLYHKKVSAAKIGNRLVGSEMCIRDRN